MLLSTNVGDISIGRAGLYAILGYAIVFFGLILLMVVVMLIGKYFTAAAKRKAATAPSPDVEPAPVTAPAQAPGSAGPIKLYNVDAKTAAMLMAIVANKLGKPLNELHFISIKEVSE